MLRDADRLLAPALERTLQALKLGPVDDAAATLAQRYAETIDAAAELARLADLALEELDPDNMIGRQRLATLAAKVGEQTVLSDLGPKLLAALTALQATPAARSRSRVGREASGQPNALQALRAARPR